MIAASPEEATRQLHELLNSASEIGADLHTVSHRLHSYTLDRLGLVAGVGAFCKEFAAQQGIHVDFSHKNVPRSVDPDIALCLFRILQEGLRNVKKHSGASKAQVTLHTANAMIHLSISDDGKGFDVREIVNKQGLGLRSMQERARLVGSRFEVRSQPRKGTEIEVWAVMKSQSDNGSGDLPTKRASVSAEASSANSAD
jgi:signal transduction histidine kinase